ncbi:hypothetical protein [Streptomyces sp. NBC_01451]|uniref:hypothetical protein n=1 Tax=Streptomyces sp. NBC_01451 TaxID=2903872 RepID=UPI002E361571|nr:hypothetical protein [Streptomyces sp. NBC_01451]
MGPPFRAARQRTARIGTQGRDEGAVRIGAPEVHALVLLIDDGEQHGLRHLGDQQLRTGSEHAQPRLVAVLHVQGQARPRAVVPRDIPAVHAESVDGCCGDPEGILSVRHDPHPRQAGEPGRRHARCSSKFLTPLSAGYG